MFSPPGIESHLSSSKPVEGELLSVMSCGYRSGLATANRLSFTCGRIPDGYLDWIFVAFLGPSKETQEWFYYYN
jgi:hypothetical protein